MSREKEVDPSSALTCMEEEVEAGRGQISLLESVQLVRGSMSLLHSIPSVRAVTSRVFYESSVRNQTSEDDGGSVSGTLLSSLPLSPAISAMSSMRLFLGMKMAETN